MARENAQTEPVIKVEKQVAGRRAMSDERRKTELPKHGIKLVVIDYSDFGESKKLVRNHAYDIEVVRRILAHAK